MKSSGGLPIQEGNALRIDCAAMACINRYLFKGSSNGVTPEGDAQIIARAPGICSDT
jgi:hypothetical protein